MQNAPLLALQNVEATYENAILALGNVTLSVAEGEMVALLGANGAGKTTTLRAISNLLGAQRGQLTRGTIEYAGASTKRSSSADLVECGLVPVFEGRRCFAHLTVEENLVTGALARRAKDNEIAEDLARVYAYFPRLREQRRLPAALCSGGEQQMVAIGRALMARPRLLVLDEPTMGLAPRIAATIFDFLERLSRRKGLSILVAEQNATLALRHADRAYVLEHGHVVLEGPAGELRARDDIKQFYLGLGEREHRNFADFRLRPAASWLN